MNKSHIALKAPEVDETRVGEVSRVIVVDTEEEVEGEGGDHGGKELRGETEKRKGTTDHSSSPSHGG